MTDQRVITGSPKGTLIVIGGREDKTGERAILRRVAEAARGGRIVLCTAASSIPDEVWPEYRDAFTALGAPDVVHLPLAEREDALKAEALRTLENAAVFFLSGGDQTKITTKIGGTAVEERIRELYRSGGVVAGTSSGASVMTEVMLAAGEADKTHRVQGSLAMAPGLGLLRGTLIDQHFAERGRIGRLLGAVSHNPAMLGIGIDEDTALVLHGGEFEVVGAGAIYIVDGRGLTWTNVCDDEPDRTMSSFGFVLHVLSSGDRFRMESRQPRHARAAS